MLGPEILKQLPEPMKDAVGGAMLARAVVGELSHQDGPTLQARVPSFPAGWVVEPFPAPLCLTPQIPLYATQF